MSPRRAERGVLHYLLLGINAGVFALVAAVAALVLIVPAVTGSVALTVLTGSMEPGLPPGSLVVVKPTDPAEVRIGSIITYQWEPDQPALVTHRVTEVVSNSDGTYSWTTQGDNNADPDPNPVTEEQLRGVVWYSLPLLGWVSNLIAGDLRPVLVPVIGGALLVYAAVLVVQSLRGKRRAPGIDDAQPVAERGRRTRVPEGRRVAGAELPEPVLDPRLEAETIEPAEPRRRREPRGSAAPGPRRSTWVEPEPVEAPSGRRARRAAERAAAEGAGTGLDSFIAPVPYPGFEPEPVPEARPAEERAQQQPEPASETPAPAVEPAAPETRRSRSGRPPASEPAQPAPEGAEEPPRRPRGKGRSYR